MQACHCRRVFCNRRCGVVTGVTGLWSPKRRGLAIT